MSIVKMLQENNIMLSEQPAEKETLFRLLADKMIELGRIKPDEHSAFIQCLKDREALSTTGIGSGIAIPHARSNLISEPVLLFLRSTTPIQYDSLDGEPVHLVFMIGVPEKASKEHLKTLTQLSRWLIDDNFREGLLKAETKKEILHILQQKDNEGSNALEQNKSKGYLIGVTACPTGIAHTYMSAENLQKAAARMGYEIKIETNGSVGVENKLTVEDISRATAVIVAADTKVNIERFAGKPMYQTNVAKGIKEPEKVIEAALYAPIYSSVDKNESATQIENSNKGPGIYASLMNGVSNMLPLVVAGGILIAISFFWGIKSATPGDPSYNQIAAMLMEIGGAAFTLFVPVLAGFIAYAIADRPGLAPGLVGGYLANTGGSGFLGAILAGFLAGYTIKFLRRALKGLPKSLDGIKPVLLFPLLSVLVVGVVTVALLNPFMGELNQWIATFLNNIGTANKVVLGVVIGAMLAADLGGPINKAAYLFSIGALASGNYYIMAAAMASGMVPSLAVAVAATLSKQKFSKSQREGAKANYILGLSFIAEGAIPFAASNPLVILPSLMVGSGVTGALAMIFNVTCPAPHGGIFVLPVIGNPILFIVSLLVGVAVSTVLILLFKRDLTTEEQLG
jgi:PTS system fructose-specific IIC component